MSIADSSHERFDGFDRGLDQLCDEFEECWKSNPEQPPLIADFLERVPESNRADLIYELVGIDLELRHRNNSEKRTVDEYLQAWPELATNPKKLDEIRHIAAELVSEGSNSDDLKTLLLNANDGRLKAATESSEVLAFAAGDQIHQFTLQEKLGAGSFGEVWKARDTHLDRIVAIKLPKRRFRKQKVRTDFIREARAAARSQHPNIVRIHQISQIGDSVYLVTDYIDGPNLADWTSDLQPNINDAVSLVTEVADALTHAHDNGIVHRDIKPANILVKAGHNGRPIPVVTDFGLALQYSEEGAANLDKDGVRLGSPAYMSPEQAKGASNRVDFRADIFSLGVVLFELITGERPFRGSSSAILEQVIHEPTPDPRILNRAVDKDLGTICFKCLEKSPSRRYASARDLADDLRRWQAGEPIKARPISSVERAYRWVAQHPLVSGLAFAVLATLIVGLVGVSHQWRRAEKKSEELRDFLYVGEMNLVQRAWRQGNRQAGVSLLEKQRPQKGEPDLRGFAWHHWWGRFQIPQQVLKLGFEVRDLDVSPNRKMAVVVGVGGSVVLVDLESYKTLKKWDGHQTDIEACGFVSNDRFVTADVGGILRLWDTKSPQCLNEVDVDSPISALDVSFPKAQLAIGCRNKSSWLFSTGLKRQRSILNDVEAVEALAFNSSGNRLAVATRETRELLVVDLPNETTRKFDEDVFASEVRWSRDDSMLVTAGLDSICKVFDVETGKVTTVASRPWLSVLGAAFTRNGQSIWICGDDTFVQKFHGQSGELEDKLIGHENTVTAMAVLEEVEQILSGSKDGTLRKWQLKRQSLIESPDLHRGSVKSVDFSSDGRTLASVGYDSNIMLYDVESSATKLKIEPTEIARRLCVRFSNDGTKLATADYLKQTVSVWDAASGERLHKFSCGVDVFPLRSLVKTSSSLLAVEMDRSSYSIWILDRGKPFCRHTTARLFFPSM